MPLSDFESLVLVQFCLVWFCLVWFVLVWFGLVWFGLFSSIFIVFSLRIFL